MNRASLERPVLLLLVLILFCTVIVATNIQSFKKPFRASPVPRPENHVKPFKVEDLKITNKTFAFNVRAVEMLNDGLIKISYENGYNKRITGINVSVGGGRVQTELTVSGDESHFIAPAATFEKVYAIQEDINQLGITVLSVIFDDGSSDGDQEYIKEMEDYRLGVKMERERVLTHLRRVLSLPDAEVRAALNRLQSEIGNSLPSGQQNTKIDNVGLGIRNERQRIYREISILSSKQYLTPLVKGQKNELREDLNQLQKLYEGIIDLSK